MNSRSTKAFTLIELLVVISIIAVLTAILLPNLVGIRGRAADARKKADLKDFQAALRLYYNDNQAFPASLSGIDEFTNGTYSTDTPEDAVYVQQGEDGYDMYVVLTNTADPDIGTSQSKCGGAVADAFYVCAR
jgi:prepilin-type N-terminal cleavage/methylation domain-containing protein